MLSKMSKWEIYVKLLSPRIRIFKEEGGQSVGTKMADNIKDTAFSKYNRKVPDGLTASVITCTKLHKLKTACLGNGGIKPHQEPKSRWHLIAVAAGRESRVF